MFIINVILTVKDGDNITKVKELLREHGRLSRAEPGCVRFEVCQAENEPWIFVLNEHWTTREDWETHREAHAVKTIYLPQVIPLVDRTPYFCELVE